MALFIIARSAAFLSLTLESGLNAAMLLEFVVFQIPVQFTTLLPLGLLAACITTFNNISNAGEYWILRAAGVFDTSFYRPALVLGAFFCLLYLPFSFEISPWALRQLQRVEAQSYEMVAQNTLINEGEPTRMGATEVFVQGTGETSLENISLFSEESSGEQIFISARQANFLRGPEGIALEMREGQVLRAQDHDPQDVQYFDRLFVNLAALVDGDAGFQQAREAENQGFFTLLRDEELPAQAQVENQKEVGRRLANLALIFAIPSWILFWVLQTRQSRSIGLRLSALGPLTLVPLFILVETPSAYATQPLPTLLIFLSCLLLLGFVGPLWAFGVHLIKHTSRHALRGALRDALRGIWGHAA